MRRNLLKPLVAFALVSCAGAQPGATSARDGCDDGSAQACYDAASDLAQREGETPENAEQLISFAQRACDGGSTAGCNTLGHYANDYAGDCNVLLTLTVCGGTQPVPQPLPAGWQANVARICGISGVVHSVGTRIPRLNGPSLTPDAARARAMFGCACTAGSRFACAHARPQEAHASATR